MVRRARLLNGASERACGFDSHLFRQEVWPSPVYGARLENERSAMTRRFESFHLRHGGVAERLIALVLKTRVPKGSRGSNPLASANLFFEYMTG